MVTVSKTMTKIPTMMAISMLLIVMARQAKQAQLALRAPKANVDRSAPLDRKARQERLGH